MNWWALACGLFAVACFIWSKYDEKRIQRKKEEERIERCVGCRYFQNGVHDKVCVLCKRLYRADSSMYKYFDDYYDIEEVKEK